ncbi:hypothetical protein PMIT1313_01329 [Prochlorococcus marinus str. MIT 1313]|uniref:hypothetical protein n=1 Tax=Prochlorococcus TaxID=1218 RepID=UPI0007B3E6D2|nr:hypothetical protein [Prochlorococcus marinus]KZR69641.1 hypothetical protein PMIT1313_01329 [Prochlorococcus marinus str. MIT 1313]KZR72411.1 hypothetical protein PMIT1318_00925 [Prochlorococcus marinus str. MIT 1318]
MAYPESQVVMGGLVHIPIIIGVFWALNNLTTGGSKAKKAAEAQAKQAAEEAAAKAAAEAAAKQAAEQAAAKAAAEAAAAKKAAEAAAAAPATTAVAPVSGEADASQASSNDNQATPAQDQEAL